MMTALRLQVKYFLENPEAADLSSFIGVFQRWIQQNTLNELLIDVADYGHVPQGPGVLLVGHYSDYGMDLSDDKLGLLYTRKRKPEDTLQKQLRVSFQKALAACRLIETEPTFTEKLKFRTDEVEVRFVDRLQFPNKPETLALIRDDLQAILAEVYGDARFSFAQVSNDPRMAFTVGVRVETPVEVAALLEQLNAAKA